MGGEPRVLPVNQTVIQRDGKSRQRREIVLSVSAGPRSGPGLMADRIQLSFAIIAGDNDLYIPPGRSVELALKFSTGRLSSAFGVYRLEAIYFLPAGNQGGSGPNHLLSNRISLKIGGRSGRR